LKEARERWQVPITNRQHFSSFYWQIPTFNLQHFYAFYGEMETLLYKEEPEDAWERVQQYWALMRASTILKGQAIRILATQIRGRCALAVGALNSAGDNSRTKKMLKIAASATRKLYAENIPWATAFAQSIDAGIETMRGQISEAIRLVGSAENEFEFTGMKMYAASARLCKGQLLEIDGSDDIAAAETFMRNQGICNPRRIAQMYLPGRWDAGQTAFRPLEPLEI
jgi:hypothetical protein